MQRNFFQKAMHGSCFVYSKLIFRELKASDQKQRRLTEGEQISVIDAISKIEREGKRLTLNAIKTRVGLTWTVDAALKELCTKLNKPLP